MATNLNAVPRPVPANDTTESPKYVPAYCDPTNERQGAKYSATRDLPTTEIAKRIRADIKAANLPVGLKVSVRTHTYSGGCAIDVRVTDLPAAMPVLSAKAASWRKQFGDDRDYPFAWREARSDELVGLVETLERIHGAYNRNNSDSMSDYFDVRYYGGVTVEYALERARAALEIEASPGTYWADDQA